MNAIGFFRWIIFKPIFKFMELGLGLKTNFLLETKNPIFINFKLSEDEAKKVQESLPENFKLEKIRFSKSDQNSFYWVSYNFYEIEYPKKELKHIHKSRCEINTYVTDKNGNKGIYVFSGSPFITKEVKFSLLGSICDLAERMVTLIYNCGHLIPYSYKIDKEKLKIQLSKKDHEINLDIPTKGYELSEQLSDDYWNFNDISYFNQGKTRDFVFLNSRFYNSKFGKIPSSDIEKIQIKGPFFSRPADEIYFSFDRIPYLVDALNLK